MQTIKVSEVVFREDLYPRFDHSQELVQQYVNSLTFLPPIKVDQHNILIDGKHRWIAHQLDGRTEINVEVIEVESEKHLKRLAYQLNSNHGLQLTMKEKQKYAREMIGEMTVEELAVVLSISERTVRDWTVNQRKAMEEERNRRVIELYLHAVNTQERIAEVVGVTQKAVSNIVENLSKNGTNADFTKTFTPSLYTVWNLAKQQTADESHFGSFPIPFMQNVLYYHTQPLDIVFDPFAGGGTTADVCKQMFRRYYCSDRIVKPGREKDIFQHDIAAGLPDNLPKPKLAFLDPPYWLQAEGQYSHDAADLGNMSIEDFNSVMAGLLKALAKRKVQTIALVIQPTQYKNGWKLVDHVFDFDKMLSKYRIAARYILPYSTQQYNAQMVEKAKKAQQCLVLHRDLVVWEMGE